MTTSTVSTDFYTVGNGYGLTVTPTVLSNFSPCSPATITWQWEFDSTSDGVSVQAQEATLSIYIVDAQSLAATTSSSSSTSTTARRRRRRGASWRHDHILAARQVDDAGSTLDDSAAGSDASAGVTTSSTSSSPVQIQLNGRTSVYTGDFVWQQVNVAPGEYVALLAINGAGSQGVAKSHTFTVVHGDVSCVKYGGAIQPSSTSSSSSALFTSIASPTIASTPSAIPTIASTSSQAPTPSSASDASTSTSSHHSHGGGIAAAVIIPLLALIAFLAFLWHRKRKFAASSANATRDAAPSSSGSITPTEMMQQREGWDTFSSPDLNGAQPLSRVSINDDVPPYTPADVDETTSPWLRVDPTAPAPGGLFNYHRNTHLSRISEVPSTMTANTADIDLAYGRSDVIHEEEDHFESIRAMNATSGLQRSDSTASSTAGGVRRKPVPTLRTIDTDDAYGDDVLASLAEDTARLPPSTSSRPASASSTLLPPSQRNSARASSNLGDFEAPLPPSDEKSAAGAGGFKSTWSVSTDGALSSGPHDSIISSTPSQRDAEMSLAYNEAVERLERERKAQEDVGAAAAVAAEEGRPSSAASASSVRTVRGALSPKEGDEESPFDDSNAVTAESTAQPKRDSRERVLLPTSASVETADASKEDTTTSSVQRAPTLSLHLPGQQSFSIDF